MKITVSLPEKHNEFQALQTDEAVATGRRLGCDIEILYADNNCILQIQQVLRAVRAADKPAAVVIEPVSPDGFESVARKVAAAGIGLAVLNCTAAYIQQLREAHPKVPIFTVSSDQVEIGRLQGRQVAALLPEGGNILYIQGAAGSTAASERFQGYSEAIAAVPALRTITVYGRWTEESAEEAVASWLTSASAVRTPVALVAAQDDSMARGARRAVEGMLHLGAGWANVPYLGIDGVPEVGQKLVQEGKLAATVVMPSNTGAAIEHMVRWLNQGAGRPAVRLEVRSYPLESDLSLRAPRTA